VSQGRDKESIETMPYLETTAVAAFGRKMPSRGLKILAGSAPSCQGAPAQAVPVLAGPVFDVGHSGTAFRVKGTIRHVAEVGSRERAERIPPGGPMLMQIRKRRTGFRLVCRAGAVAGLVLVLQTGPAQIMLAKA